MWSTISNFKENLNKIALDVHEDDDDDEELEIYSRSNGNDSSVLDRRVSHRFAHSKSVSQSPVANGINSAYNSEIEQYKAEIKKLQESEAEIKALSVNYAALLKEKEDQIFRLSEENGSLKINLNATNAALNASRNESYKTSTTSPNAFKGNSDQSPNRQHKFTTQAKIRSAGNQVHNGTNGIADDAQPDFSQTKMEAKYLNLLGKQKELADLLEEKNRSLAAAQATHELQMTQLRAELEKERDKLSTIQQKLQEERKLNGSFQDELKTLKVDKEKTSIEMSKIRKEMDEKLSELRRLQVELNRREDEDADDNLESLRSKMATLEKENTNLKMGKDDLEAALQNSTSCLNEKVHPSGNFPGKEEMELSLSKLEDDLNEAWRERDKALQQLARLKQHLLDKESEDSEKMDEDSKIIEELRQNNEFQRAQILHLEKALKQAIASQEEVKMMNNNELKNSRETIEDLNRRLANSMSTIDAKNAELLNLQTALGQYYAEIEAKERLERDLAMAREEAAKLSGFLKDAHQKAELTKSEKEEILTKLSQAERLLGEGKNRVKKLEEDNGKLRRALEQSMTRLNRMSLDSDYFVDRRIVIKLLVTYFQRNHSKEVLDLMVRMLGFSEEEKQRIGGAQQGVGGKGVVRGVLGFPGRFVGGILGGSGGSAEGQANVAPENGSFADLWVDFLLKETEERERRGSVEANAAGPNQENVHERSPSAAEQRSSASGMPSGSSRLNSQSPNQKPSPQIFRGNFEHADSEFSTVPLTSSESNSRFSRLLPK